MLHSTPKQVFFLLGWFHHLECNTRSLEGSTEPPFLMLNPFSYSRHDIEVPRSKSLCFSGKSQVKMGPTGVMVLKRQRAAALKRTPEMLRGVKLEWFFKYSRPPAQEPLSCSAGVACLSASRCDSPRGSTANGRWQRRTQRSSRDERDCQSGWSSLLACFSTASSLVRKKLHSPDDKSIEKRTDTKTHRKSCFVLTSVFGQWARLLTSVPFFLSTSFSSGGVFFFSPSVIYV